MLNVKTEISRDPPPSAAGRIFKDGEPILYAYECVLLERATLKGFVYTAVNLKTDNKEVLSRRTTPLSTSGVEAIAERLRNSCPAGAGRLQADRPYKEQISLEKAREILNAVFTEIMPENGFAVRTEQIDFANHILTTLTRQGVTLGEAETGTGKTHGYLVPAIIAKRGHLNSFNNMDLYPGMPYADMPKMPIVIATSSIALQRAIMTEYIPQLSDMLSGGGVIKEPLTAVLRKGREHYVCLKKLNAYLANVSNRRERERLEGLLVYSEAFDLAEVDGLPPRVKQNISVQGRCFDTCPHKDNCRYTAYRDRARSLDIDIQICNHNYLLADTLCRVNKQNPLIPNYQMLIVDEAHKFLSAARTMYGAEMSSKTAPVLFNSIGKLSFRREGIQNAARRGCEKLNGQSDRLFKRLLDKAQKRDDGDGETTVAADIDADAAKNIRNMHGIINNLIALLEAEGFYVKTFELLAWVRDKYGANVSGIQAGRFLNEIAADNDALNAQIMGIHRAVCELPEIKRKIKTERATTPTRGESYNPERQLFRKQKSKVLDTIWKRSKLLFRSDVATGRNSERVVRLIRELTELRDQTAALAKHDELITWLASERDEHRLCAIPKDLSDRLFTDQWSKGIPTVLTSGTLSAGGDFSHIRRTLGFDRLGSRLTETTKPSPFNYRKNALLYISNRVPFPDQKNREYLAAVADEVEKLIDASHGHTAVLFTGYKAMDMVWEQVSKHKLPFPMFRLDKGGVREIEKFKTSRSGILFASGALWEGIDIPGDALSMLIIVKLPFAVPDAIGEYDRRAAGDNWRQYADSILVPEMLIKLKQGFGRLIRTETDTGCVAILDCRAAVGGLYRKPVLAALPPCEVTDDIERVRQHFKLKKSDDYFK